MEGQDIEVSIFKGALIAGAIALVVCALPCLLIVCYIRKKKMTSEVKLVDNEGNIEKVVWTDKEHGIEISQSRRRR